MKKYILIFLFAVSAYHSFGIALSAQMLLDVPESASTNGEPFTVSVYVDAAGGKLSALSGEITFDSSVFTVDAITTRGSIVPLWVEQPKVSTITLNNGTTTISFAGIIPGGYDGVRSPYSIEKKLGVVLLISLRPKKESIATINLSNIRLHAFDEYGTVTKQQTQISSIYVPKQSIIYNDVLDKPSETTSNTLQVLVERNSLVSNNAWYVRVEEDQTIRPIERIYIVESYIYNPRHVPENGWSETSGIYILKNQNKNKYIHVKIEYQNNTYTFITVSPVENFSSTLNSSRILLGIVCILILFILYQYGSFIKQYVKKTYISQSNKK